MAVLPVSPVPHYHIINQPDFLPSYLGGSAAGLCKHYLLSFPPRQDKPSVKNPTNLCSLIQKMCTKSVKQQEARDLTDKGMIFIWINLNI